MEYLVRSLVLFKCEECIIADWTVGCYCKKWYRNFRQLRSSHLYLMSKRSLITLVC